MVVNEAADEGNAVADDLNEAVVDIDSENDKISNGHLLKKSNANSTSVSAFQSSNTTPG